MVQQAIAQAQSQQQQQRQQAASTAAPPPQVVQQQAADPADDEAGGIDEGASDVAISPTAAGADGSGDEFAHSNMAVAAGPAGFGTDDGTPTGENPLRPPTLSPPPSPVAAANDGAVEPHESSRAEPAPAATSPSIVSAGPSGHHRTHSSTNGLPLASSGSVVYPESGAMCDGPAAASHTSSVGADIASLPPSDVGSSLQLGHADARRMSDAGRSDVDEELPELIAPNSSAAAVVGASDVASPSSSAPPAPPTRDPTTHSCGHEPPTTTSNSRADSRSGSADDADGDAGSQTERSNDRAAAKARDLAHALRSAHAAWASEHHVQRMQSVAGWLADVPMPPELFHLGDEPAPLSVA